MLKTLSFFLLVLSFSVQGQRDYDSLIQKAKSFQLIDPDSVLHFAKAAIDLDQDDKSDAYYWIGVGLRMKSNYDSSLYWYNRSLETAKTLLQKGNAQMGLGGAYYSKEVFHLSLEYYYSAEKIFRDIGAQERLAAVYGNIGSVLNINDTNGKAKDYFLKSIQMYGELGLDDKKLPPLVNLASLYMGEESYDSAILYAKHCYQIADSMNSPYGVGRATVILAPSFSRNGNPQVGYKYAQEGIEVFEQLGVTNLTFLMTYNKAEALFYLNEIEDALALCLSIEPALKEKSILERLFELMSKIYEKKGDFEKALIYQRKYQEEFENFIQEEKARYLDRLETQFEMRQKESEILMLQNEVELQELQASRKNWIIGLVGIAVFLVILSIWFFYQNRLSQEKEQSAIHKQQLLRSQINPHFIFNSLSSIRGFLFDGNDTKPAITYLGKFAKLMRLVMELSSKEWVSLEEEINALELYLEIQQIRFNKAFDFDLNIDEALEPDEIMVPPLTAQPFIENAIEHGLKGMDTEGKVEIECLKKHGKLIFKILDNGVGIDHVEPEENHQSRAIQIFKERLSIIGKRMKMTFSFNITDIGNQGKTQGTLVMYELPLVKA